MARIIPVSFLIFAVIFSGCPGRSEVPESAYDPELVAAAKAAAERAAREEAAREQDEAAEEINAEYNRGTRGCKKGDLSPEVESKSKDL